VSRNQTFIGTHEAARLLQLSTTHVVRLADVGKLPVAKRDHNGHRLFLKSEVETFIRKKNSAKRTAARRVLAQVER
jgi:excisionase family DNA binding protein